MSISYSVLPCNSGGLPDIGRDDDLDDFSDYVDQLNLLPRGSRPENHTVLVKVCKKPLDDNSTQSGNSTGQNVTHTEEQAICKLKRVTVTSARGQADNQSEGGIPLDILEKLERDEEWTVTNQTGPGKTGGGRQRRQAEGNWTDGDIGSGASEEGGAELEIGGGIVGNITDTAAEVKSQGRSDMPSEESGPKEELEESNEISLTKKVVALEPSTSEEMDTNFVWKNLIQSEPEQLRVDLPLLEYNYTADNNQTQIDLSLEYDDYGNQVLFSTCVLYIYKGQSLPTHLCQYFL